MIAKLFIGLLLLCFTHTQAQTFKYDDLGRVAGIKYERDREIKVQFDPNGNRSGIIIEKTLPIQLLLFEATKEKNQVLLAWEVTKEVNLAKYEVQFSMNAQSFQTFATFISKGSSIKIDYNTIHCCPVLGNNYYRLKMVDKDGKFTYSEIHKVVYEDVNSFKIYPNPVANKANLTVSFEMPLSSNSTVYIYNVLGSRVVATSFAKGQSIYNFKLPALAAGTYFITINTKDKLYQSKFIKE